VILPHYFPDDVSFIQQPNDLLERIFIKKDFFTSSQFIFYRLESSRVCDESFKLPHEADFKLNCLTRDDRNHFKREFSCYTK
jgi:hypothetical protein